MKIIKVISIISIIFIILIISTNISSAYDITFAWDSNGVNVEGFYLYENDTNIATIDPNNRVLNPNKDSREDVLPNVTSGVKYYYMTAYDIYGGESTPSNVTKFDSSKVGTETPTLKIKSVKDTVTETITKVIEKVTNYF